MHDGGAEAGRRGHLGGAEWLGRVVGGRYRLLRPVGSGGMGTVFEGEEMATGVRVAVKVLHAEHVHDEELSGRFRREGEVLRTLTHPNIVHALDAGGEEDAAPFIVFEFLRGENLAQRLARRGTLSIVEAMNVAAAVAEALEFSHGKGVVHRDVKPENIFIHLDDAGNARVRLLDFGIAKQEELESRLTHTGMVFGSARYMSPEQLMDTGAVGPSADTYALAVVLYEMLTGEPPFDAPTFGDLQEQIMFEAPAPIASLRSDVPLWLERNILAGLEKRPDRRPPEPSDLVSLTHSRELLRASVRPPAPRSTDSSAPRRGPAPVGVRRGRDLPTRLAMGALVGCALVLLSGLGWAAASDLAASTVVRLDTRPVLSSAASR